MAWTRVPRLRAKSVAASPPAAWTNQSSGDFCTVSTLEGETKTVPPGGTTGSVEDSGASPHQLSGWAPGTGGSAAARAPSTAVASAASAVPPSSWAYWRSSATSARRVSGRSTGGEAAPVLVRVQRRDVVQEGGGLFVLGGHGGADQHLAGAGDGGGEAAQFVIADLAEPAQRIELQGVLHAVLDGVGEQRAAEQFAAEPGVGPHAFLEAGHDHDRPFASGGAGRGHQLHGVLQLGPGGQGVHRQFLAEQVLEELFRPGTGQLVHVALGGVEQGHHGVEVPVRPGSGRAAGQRGLGPARRRVRWSATAPTARFRRCRRAPRRPPGRPGSSGRSGGPSAPRCPGVARAPGSSSASTSSASLVRPPPPSSSSRRSDWRSRRSSMEVAPPIREVSSDDGGFGREHRRVQGHGIGVQQRPDGDLVPDGGFGHRESGPGCPGRPGSAAAG